MRNFAFQVNEDDVANVLASNWSRVGNSEGRSFTGMAEQIFGGLDFQAIEDAALMGDNLDQQTDYAYDEIERQLCLSGVLAALRT